MKFKVRYTVKGYIPAFEDVVDVPHGTDEEIKDALDQVCQETFHDDRAVVRELLLIQQAE